MVKTDMRFWVLLLIVIFVIALIIEYIITGGFVTLGAKIIVGWLNATFGDYSIYVQGVLSVVVIIVLILFLRYAHKKQWF